MSTEEVMDAVATFYRKAKWPVGTHVRETQDPTHVGVIVGKGGTIWVNRDKLPWVRWDRKIDAVQVPWEQLESR